MANDQEFALLAQNMCLAVDFILLYQFSFPTVDLALFIAKIGADEDDFLAAILIFLIVFARHDLVEGDLFVFI